MLIVSGESRDRSLLKTYRSKTPKSRSIIDYTTNTEKSKRKEKIYRNVKALFKHFCKMDVAIIQKNVFFVKIPCFFAQAAKRGGSFAKTSSNGTPLAVAQRHSNFAKSASIGTHFSRC